MDMQPTVAYWSVFLLSVFLLGMWLYMLQHISLLGEIAATFSSAVALTSVLQ